MRFIDLLNKMNKISEQFLISNFKRNEIKNTHSQIEKIISNNVINIMQMFETIVSYIDEVLKYKIYDANSKIVPFRNLLEQKIKLSKSNELVYKNEIINENVIAISNTKEFSSILKLDKKNAKKIFEQIAKLELGKNDVIVEDKKYLWNQIIDQILNFKNNCKNKDSDFISLIVSTYVFIVKNKIFVDMNEIIALKIASYAQVYCGISKTKNISLIYSCYKNIEIYKELSSLIENNELSVEVYEQIFNLFLSIYIDWFDTSEKIITYLVSNIIKTYEYLNNEIKKIDSTRLKINLNSFVNNVLECEYFDQLEFEFLYNINLKSSISIMEGLLSKRIMFEISSYDHTRYFSFWWIIKLFDFIEKNNFLSDVESYCEKCWTALSKDKN